MGELISSFMGWVALKVEERPILAAISTVIAAVLTIGVLAWAIKFTVTAAT